MSTWNGLLSPCSEMCFLNRDFLYITLCHCVCCVCVCVHSGSVVSNSMWPPGLYLTRLSAHGIFQDRILEWIAISYSKGSFWPRDRTHISWVSCISRQILYHWASWEAVSPCTMSQLTPEYHLHLPPLHTRWESQTLSWQENGCLLLWP